MNQFTTLTGLVLGALTAVPCMPYITAKLWGSGTRVIMIVTSSVILFMSFVTALFLFYGTQPSNIGSWINLDCIPFDNYTCLDNS